MNRDLRVLLCLLAATACSTTRAAGEGPMESALEAVQGGSGSPREKALAGWHRYLLDGDPKAAEALFTGSGDDLVGLAGRLELSRRSLNVDERAKLAVRLASLGAEQPLGRVAAHTMLDLVGQSSQLDTQLADGAQQILKGKASPGVAFLCRMVVARVGELRATEGWAQHFKDAGAIDEYALAGPFGALRNLDFPKPYPPEQEDVLQEKYVTPVGEVFTRPLRFPSADVRLYGEPERGDVFFLASDLTVQGGDYIVHTVGTAPHAVFVDGQRVILREPASLEGGQQAAGITLAAGPHRVLLKLSRADGHQVAVFLVRGDGGPEDLHAHAASGPPPTKAAPVAADGALPTLPVRAKELFAQLAPELGNVTARYVAARDAMPRDLEGAKALLAGIEPFPETAPMLVLRAQLTLGDHNLPDRTARGRAGHDLEVASTKDPGDAAAWVLRAGQARDAERFDDTQLFLSKAEAATHSPIVTVNQARLSLARGLDGPADASARHALESLPGFCDALELRYGLARAHNAVADADALNRELLPCPDGLERAAEHARARADLSAAEKAQALRLERQPTNWRIAVELADVLIAAKRYPEAQKAISAQLPFWPRLGELHRRLGDLLTLSGDAAAALKEKRAALSLDGADLSLRRQLALAQGHELLDEFAVDAKQVIAQYEKSPAPPGAENASNAYVLDLAGIQILPDGTELERIHTIAQVLDQRGIPQLAEQHIPQGAVVLKLQTIKKDGRVLEPEALGDKEGVSLPNVQVGDYVEIEYLQARPPRSPAEPGWASVPFYFRIAESPLFRSTYTVEAPAGTPIKVDAHNMDAPAPKQQGDQVVVHHEAHQVPLFIPEPGASGGNEYLPFMQAGTGASTTDVLWPFADSSVGHDAPTLEVAQFARAVVGEKQGLEALQALYAAVSEKVKGDENDINDRASLTLARERGSRLWLLKGALKAVGIPAHLALVRPLAADPAPYLFPNADLFTYPVLLVELPNAEPIWLDPSVRFGPFNELPEQVAGERDAVVLPDPGEKELRKLRTPPSKPVQPKQVKLAISLSPEGDVVGDGEETYFGFDAAFLRSALDRFDETQRKQAVEVALARSFRGASLEKLDVIADAKVGATVTLRYHFTSPRWARAETGRLVLATPIFPAALGQRYVALAQRTTPMLVSGSESSATQIRITLPVGFKPTNVGVPASIETQFGTYKRAVKTEPAAVVIDEYAQVNEGRIAPKVYGEFVRFTAAVDQAQQQQLELTR